MGLSAFPGPDWYTMRVDLTVMDVNDNAPEWTMVPFPYLSVVSAISPPNTLVYKLQARDGDEGINGEVEYFLSDGKQIITDHYFQTKCFLSTESAYTVISRGT